MSKRTALAFVAILLACSMTTSFAFADTNENAADSSNANSPYATLSAGEVNTDSASLPKSVNVASVSFSGDTTYTGKPIKPSVSVSVGNERLVEGADYTLRFYHNTNAGTAFVCVVGCGEYTGSVYTPFTITRADQPMQAEALYKKATVGKPMLKKGYRTLYSPINVDDAEGAVTYKNVSNSIAGRSVKVALKTGNMKLPKKLKSKRIKVNVEVTASGNRNYLGDSQEVNVVIANGSKRVQLAQTALNEWRRGVADGTNNIGGKRYWKRWSKSRVAWCSEFAAWCSMKIGLKPGVDIPKKPVNSKQFLMYYLMHPKEGTLHIGFGTHKPKVGDIVLRAGKKGVPNHTGIVVSTTKNGFQTVEGNVNDKVLKRSYTYRESKKWRYFITIK